MEHLKCRMQALQLGPGIGGGELPVDVGAPLIPLHFPSGHFPAGDLQVWQASVQALAAQDA